MGRQTIYTVGHSTHQLDYFLELLQAYKINCLVDVRSVAASSYNPQYNKEPLSNFLKNNGVTYMHFAEEFGARHGDPELLDDEGRVDFEKVRKSWIFQNGVERLWQGINKGFTIALMCSESDPFDCHRFSMVSIALQKDGFNVLHILKDKTIKTNAELENQLLKKYDKKLPKPDMFEPNITLEDQLKAAYRLRNKEIAFSPYEKQPEEKYDPEIRAGAAWGLGEQQNKSALTAIVTSFNSVELNIKVEATRALAKLTKNFSTDILKKFEKASPNEKPGIAWALTKSTSLNPDQLVANLKDLDSRHWVSYIIGTHGEERYIKEIEKLKKKDPEVYFAVTLLWKIMTSWIYELKEY